MLETLAISTMIKWGIGTVFTFIIGLVLKRIDNRKISDFVRKWAKRAGIVVTLGLSKWKYTAPFWNKIIEPFVIDLLENTVQAAVRGFILGLRSDNPDKS